MEALSRPDFYTTEELAALPEIGLNTPENSSERRAVLGALILAVVLEVTMTDGATTTGEFEVVEDLIDQLERNLELTSREKLEEIGTEMGMVPFIAGVWTREQFRRARAILAAALDRLGDETAHSIRSLIAKYCYEAAKASGGLLKITNISNDEEHADRDRKIAETCQHSRRHPPPEPYSGLSLHPLVLLDSLTSFHLLDHLEQFR